MALSVISVKYDISKEQLSYMVRQDMLSTSPKKRGNFTIVKVNHMFLVLYKLWQYLPLILLSGWQLLRNRIHQNVPLLWHSSLELPKTPSLYHPLILQPHLVEQTGCILKKKITIDFKIRDFNPMNLFVLSTNA